MSAADSTPPPPEKTGRFLTGCAVWAYADWVGEFYPEGSKARDFLSLYGQRLTAVEGNTTFYAVPNESTVSHWASQLPEGFELCPKLPRDISHEGDVGRAGPMARAFLERMSPLGARLGPCFLQLPGTFGPRSLDDLRGFLDAWPFGHRSLAVEVRHPDWYEAGPREALREVLSSAGAGRVVLDSRAVYSGTDDPQRESNRRKPKLPVQPEVTAPFAFIRFIGHPSMERSEEFLLSWAAQVDTWLRAGTDVYFFLHCPREERSPHLARRFHALLTARGAPVDPLPWDTAPAPRRQGTLFS